MCQFFFFSKSISSVIDTSTKNVMFRVKITLLGIRQNIRGRLALRVVSFSAKYIIQIRNIFAFL